VTPNHQSFAVETDNKMLISRPRARPNPQDQDSYGVDTSLVSKVMLFKSYCLYTAQPCTQTHTYLADCSPWTTATVDGVVGCADTA